MFQETILNAHDVCSNCFRQRRREVVQPTTDGDHHYFERTPHLNTAHVPDVPAASSRRVYCECGADSAYTRQWTDEDVDRERFKAFVKRVIRTLDAVACITVDRQQFAAAALRAFDRIPDPDLYGPFRADRSRTINDALAAGIEETVDVPVSTGREAVA